MEVPANFGGGAIRFAPFQGLEYTDVGSVSRLWASWCPPCRREMTMMATTAANRADAVFVFANQGESAQTASRFLARADLEVDHIVLHQGYALAQHYSVSGYPATLFLDAAGTLRSLHFGEISREAIAAGIDSAKAEWD